jgi:hypothetical protein
MKSVTAYLISGTLRFYKSVSKIHGKSSQIVEKERACSK